MRDRKYRRSAAREEALDRLKFLKQGATVASRKAIPPMVRDMVYHSAVFQASSTLEEYLKQIFDHWLFELKRNKRTGQHVPSRARYSYAGRELSQEFSKFSYIGDEKALAQKLQEKSSVMAFAMGASDILPNLTGEFAYKDKKYPSPKNIRQLYSRIGCDNIFDQISREIKSNAELKLQGFNDVRSAIAHGSPPNITLIDVKRNLHDVSLIIMALDRINHREFSRDFGGGVW